MRALVLSGGGSRGSWQAGVLKCMGEHAGELFPGGFEFVSGTSVGAINSTAIAMYPSGQFAEATGYLADMWCQHINATSDVWNLRWPAGIPGLWNPSVGTNDQLQVLLEKLVDVDAVQQSDVQVRYTAVDMETAEVRVYTGEDLVKHGVAPIMASASYPLAFPPVEIGNDWLSDGGLRDTAPVGSAIEAGADEIVVVACRDPYETTHRKQKEMGTLLPFALRSISIMMHETISNDVKLCELYNHWGQLGSVLEDHGVDADTAAKVVNQMNANKRVVKLTVIYPSKPLGNPLDFSGKLMKARFEQGYQDAKKALGLDG